MSAKRGHTLQPDERRGPPAFAGGLPKRLRPTLGVRRGERLSKGVSGRFSAGQHKRTRTGVSCFVAGVLLLLWAWGSWIYRTSVTGSELAAAQAEPLDRTPEATEVVRALPLFLLVGLLLVLAFLAGSYVLVRSSRRYRKHRWQSGRLTQHSGSATSQMDDVWAMHKLPDDTDSNDTGPRNSER